MRMVRIGNIVYNGQQFPIATKSTCTFTSVEDSAKRTTKYLNVYIRCEFLLTVSDLGGSSSQTLDSCFPQFLSTITLNGATLIFSGQGIGNITANYQNCVGYGPFPRVVHWEPWGANLAARVIWECEFTITACSFSGNGIVSNFAEFTYSVNWSTPYSGYTRRTITGRAEKFISRTSDAGHTINSDADDLWDQISNSFPLLPGFKRDVNRTLSNDRRFLDFSITDDEIQTDNPYPPSILDCSCTHNIRSEMGHKGGLFHWIASFDGSFRVAPGVPRATAWAAFLTLIQDRLGFYQSNGGFATNAMSIRISITEDIWENRVIFSFSYGILIPAGGGIGAIFAYSGIFRPAPFDWNAWTLSLQDIMGGRGVSGLAFNAYADPIIDGCSPNNFGTIDSPNKPTPNQTLPSNTTASCPMGDYGWTYYDNSLSVYQDTQAIVSARLGQGSTTSQFQPYSATPNSSDPSGQTTLTGGGFTNNSTGQNYATYQIQQRTPGIALLVMEGSEVRVGQPIGPTPAVQTIGGQPAVLAHVDYDRQPIIGWDTNGCTIYRASWRKVYYLNSTTAEQAVVIINVPNPYQAQSQLKTQGLGPPAQPNQ